MSERVEDKFEV